MSRRTAGRLKRRPKSKKQPGLMLTSLMDVFTLLLFFLMINTSGSDPLKIPSGLKPPTSISNQQPKEGSIAIIASKDVILIKNKPIIEVATVMSRSQIEIPEIIEALKAVRDSDLGGLEISAEGEEDPRDELVILADRDLSYEFVRKLLISGRKAGFLRLTFAANEK